MGLLRVYIDVLAGRKADVGRLMSQFPKTGRYLLQDNYPIDIAAADGRLTFTAAGQPPAVLLPLPTGRYRHPGLNLEITFQRTDDQPYTMELRQEGTAQTATQAANPPTELP